MGHEGLSARLKNIRIRLFRCRRADLLMRETQLMRYFDLNGWNCAKSGLRVCDVLYKCALAASCYRGDAGSACFYSKGRQNPRTIKLGIFSNILVYFFIILVYVTLILRNLIPVLVILHLYRRRVISRKHCQLLT